MKRLSVLDYTIGEAYTYILTEEQLQMEQEDLINELGHGPSNCYWMYH